MLQHEYQYQHGVNKKFFTQEQMEEFVSIFKKLPTTSAFQYTNCHGIAPGNLAMPWAKRFILDPIFKNFIGEIKPIFLMLLDSVTPFPLHQDRMPIDSGNHYLTFIIPYSVNNDVRLVDNATTRLYEQDKTTVLDEIKWELGDLIWFDSGIWHDSNDFLSDGFESKQGLVIHTYVD